MRLRLGLGWLRWWLHTGMCALFVPTISRVAAASHALIRFLVVLADRSMVSETTCGVCTLRGNHAQSTEERSSLWRETHTHAHTSAQGNSETERGHKGPILNREP